MKEAWEKMTEDIHKKLDQILVLTMDARDRSIRNEATLKVNTEDMRYHIKRTDHLEELVQISLKPIRWVKTTGKIIIWLGALSTAAAAITKFFEIW